MNGNLEKLEEIAREYRKKLATYLSFVVENMDSFPQSKDVLFINAKFCPLKPEAIKERIIDEGPVNGITLILLLCTLFTISAPGSATQGIRQFRTAGGPKQQPAKVNKIPKQSRAGRHTSSRRQLSGSLQKTGL